MMGNDRRGNPGKVIFLITSQYPRQKYERENFVPVWESGTTTDDLLETLTAFAQVMDRCGQGRSKPETRHITQFWQARSTISDLS